MAVEHSVVLACNDLAGSMHRECALSVYGYVWFDQVQSFHHIEPVVQQRSEKKYTVRRVWD